MGEVGSFPPMPDNDRCVCGVRRSGVIGNQNQRAQYDRRSTMLVATLLLLLSMTAPLNVVELFPEWLMVRVPELPEETAMGLA